MNIIVNCINLNKGGGVQVALSLLEEFKCYLDIKFIVFYSKSLENKIEKDNYPPNFSFIYFPHSPDFLPKRYQTLKTLRKLEKSISPNFVFTIFGPAYWHPKAPHLTGYAIPHFIYPESPFWSTAGLEERLKFYLLKRIKIRFFKNDGEYFHTETEDAKDRLCRFFNIPANNILVASNSYHPVFDRLIERKFELPDKRGNEFRLITISAYYSHKNLGIINQLTNELNKQDKIFFRFVVTLPDDVFNKYFIKSDNLLNIGTVKIEDCPSIYKQCDALFLPTFLEVFSANYVEAMKMEIPILTSNLSFATNICGNAAIYFNPLDIKDIALKILELTNNKILQKELIKNGIEKLYNYDTPKQRAKKIIEFMKLKLITKQQNNV